jgi:type VI secretion system VgrG family protein
VSDRLHPVVIDILFPQGPSSDWQVISLRGTEAISGPYQFELELVCDDQPVEAEALLGADCELLLDRNGVARAIYGVVDQVEELATSAVRVRVVPAFWLLEQTIDTRFFAGQTVIEILREVLQPALAAYDRTVDVESHIKNSYLRRDYCVQFRESTFAFCNRIMEEEGIACIFVPDEASQREILVLIDNNQDYEDVELLVPGAVPIVESRAEELDRESLQECDWRSARQPNRVVMRGYNMKVPQPPDEGEAEHGDGQRPVVREHYHDDDVRQIIDDPVDDPDAQSFTGAGLGQRAAQAKRLLEVHTLAAERGRGRGNALGFAAGRVFRLGDHANPALAHHKFLLTRVTHEASRGDGAEHHSYSNRFECAPLERPFRPALKTPRPRVHGVQTGVVVGRVRDEVYTDQFGRVRVKFHRDRHSQADERASCWIRVAQIWAGPGYGSMVIPRVGMEVVVSFIDGNPDCPIVTGCVYDGTNMPPYALPGELSKTTFKTSSTPTGDGFNELRFEDAHGHEQIFVHAQRRMDVRVRGSLYETSGGSREEMIGGERDGNPHGDHNTLVHKDVNHHVKEIRYTKIDKQEYATVGADLIEDYQARHVVLVGELSQLSAPKIVVEASELISNKADEIKLSGSTTVSVKGGGKVVVESNNAIEFKVGNSFVSITPDGVSIQGLTVRLNSGGGVGSASEADAAEAAELLEPLDALAADDGRPGSAGGGRGGGGRSRNSRSLEPHRAPPMKPPPPAKPGRPTVLPDGRIRQLLSVGWLQTEIWCSETATLAGIAKNYQAGDSELATITNAVDGAVQRSFVVPIEGPVFKHSFEVLDVLPRRSPGGYEAERTLHASIAGLMTPLATRVRFIPKVERARCTKSWARFDLHVDNFEVIIGGTIKFVRGWLHYVIQLGDTVPPETDGLIGTKFLGSYDWRYCKKHYERDTFRGLKYWNGAEWLDVPSSWQDRKSTKRKTIGVWLEGGVAKVNLGKRLWPDPVPEWGRFSAEQVGIITSSWKREIEEFWTGNFDIQRNECHSSNPQCCRYKVRCSVDFEEVDVLPDGGIVITANGGRANASTWPLWVEGNAPMHEFGHHIGNPDEYEGASTVDPTVNTDGATAGIDPHSIMGAGNEVRRRHFNTACEFLSTLIKQQTGQDYTYVAVPVVPP